MDTDIKKLLGELIVIISLVIFRTLALLLIFVQFIENALYYIVSHRILTVYPFLLVSFP